MNQYDYPYYLISKSLLMEDLESGRGPRVRYISYAGYILKLNFHNLSMSPNDLKRFGFSITRDSDRECKEFFAKLSFKFFY